MEYKLKDLIDIPRMREVFDTFDAIHSMPSAIIDIEGNVLRDVEITNLPF